MKNLLLSLVLSALALSGFSQSITCPQDVTVGLFDLDTQYESYGDPDYSGPSTYEVTKNITTIDNSCNSPFQLNVTVTYNLIEISTSANVASCTQSISVERATLDDITLPEDYEITEGSLEDLAPEFAGQPEPNQTISQYSLIATTYEDVVISTANGVKVIREWTLLNWCTSEQKTHTQILKIENLTSDNRASNVTNCNNAVVEVEDVTIRTDVVGYTIDYGTCSTEGTSLLDFVNCVAANNDIPASSNFSIEINRSGDDQNGVSTLDLVLIQRHILGINSLDDNCLLLASDVNNDQRITAIDLVEMRKLILGIYTEYPQSPSWKFVNLKQLEQNSIGINVVNSDNDLSFRKSEFPLSELNIIAIKIGDVNGSAQGN